MSSFDLAIRTILRHEGGFVDNPNDPGGATNYGISLRFLKGADIDIDRDGEIDREDITGMSENDAKKIYLERFWEPGKYVRIHNQDIATKAFDLGVNMGIRQGAKIVQRAVRACKASLGDDGILGPISFAVINNQESQVLMAAIRSEAAGFYRGLIMRNAALRRNGIEVRDFSVFLRGWLWRAYD